MILLKNDEVIDCLRWPLTNFSALKLFKLQHQFSNIIESTQLTNKQMPEFHCHHECSVSTASSRLQHKFSVT